MKGHGAKEKGRKNRECSGDRTLRARDTRALASVILPQLGEEFETAFMASLVLSFSGANSKILEHLFLQILCDFLSENEYGRRCKLRR